MEINIKRGKRRKNTVTEMVSLSVIHPYIFIVVSIQHILLFSGLIILCLFIYNKQEIIRNGANLLDDRGSCCSNITFLCNVL